jgi:hypothetical protein
MIRKLVMALVLFTLLFCGAIAHPAYAASVTYNGPFGSVCSGGGAASSVCTTKSTGNPLTGNDGVIVKATDLIAFFAGAAAVILIIFSGIRYITSGGDAGRIGSAKNTLINAIVGLVIIVLARVIVVYVVSKIK